MDQVEIIQYLANIFYLSNCDKGLDVNEDSLILKIAETIGGGYLETRKALDLSFEKEFQITLPQRYSDQVRCLEDMLLIAYSDNKLHEMEKKIISKYCKAIDISKQQLGIIKAQTKSRLKD